MILLEGKIVPSLENIYTPENGKQVQHKVRYLLRINSVQALVHNLNTLLCDLADSRGEPPKESGAGTQTCECSCSQLHFLK